MSSSYHCLTQAQLKRLFKSRFDIVLTEYPDIGDGDLTLKRCQNLYEALSYATTGTVLHESIFRRETLHFIQYCWFNPAVQNILEEDIDLQEYAQKQQIDFDSCPIPPWLEVKAAATFLQVNICVFVPSENTNIPTYCFRPAVLNLNKRKHDRHEYDPRGCINIAAHKIDIRKYRFEIVTAFPRSVPTIQKARRRRWTLDDSEDGDFVQLNQVKVSYSKAVEASDTFVPYRNKHINVDADETTLKYLKTLIETDDFPEEALFETRHVHQLYTLAISFEIADLTDFMLSHILQEPLFWKIEFVNTEKDSLLPTNELYDNLVDEITNADSQTLQGLNVDPNLSATHKKLRKVLEREKTLKSNIRHSPVKEKALENLQRFFSQNTDPNSAIHICELIGYPKHKYLAKQRLDTTYTQCIDKVLDEWYPVAKSFCETSETIKPKHMLARAYILANQPHLFEQLIPSTEKQTFVRANEHAIFTICVKTADAFERTIRPRRSRNQYI